MCKHKLTTRKTIEEEIEYLEDDNIVMINIINSIHASFIEKAECRSRLRSNNNEIMHLKSLLISLKGDILF